MDYLPDKNKIRLYAWLALGYLCLGFLTTWSNHPDQHVASFINNVWAVCYLTLFNFILLEYTIPYVLQKKKYYLYNFLAAVALLFFHAILYSYGLYTWRRLGIGLHIYTPLKEFPTLSHLLENQMAYSMGSVFFYGIIRHFYQYAKLKQATQQLRIEKQQAELNYLKAQTNPHFLFNTLNNIYALARDKSDLAPESIMRLSKILRFMLYETSGAYIAVEQELKMIDDYIALERLRYDDSLQVNLSHDIEDMRQALPPLLLIPLVENAFKHGVSEMRGKSFVDIYLSVKKRNLQFVVSNSWQPTAGEENTKENIGLSNLRRQLQLLYTDYELLVTQVKDVFKVSLKINLASHA